MIEQRAHRELRAVGRDRLAGYAAVFDSPSHDLGGFVEVIRPGAFARSLRSAEHVRALYDHDSKQLLGRVGAGTLRLNEDAKGLAFEVDLPGTTYARDLAALVERGDVAGCSFAFSVGNEGQRWQRQDDGLLRELVDVNLGEITITANPAYPDTTVARRSLEAWRGQSVPSVVLARLYLSTLR
jgi:HK97 family phage prohead protease